MAAMTAPLPGPLALVGSGEFLPAMAQTDAAMLEGREPVVAVLPTAAAPEGEASTRRWFDLAHRHYDGLGARVVEVDVRVRADAEDPATAALLDGVGMVYLSGGNPAHLVDVLAGTPVADAIASAWRAGAALAGCSAGAMALGSTTFSLRGPTLEGLGLADGIGVIPHFDRLGFAQRFVGAVAARRGRPDVVVGVDEDTAVVWQPARRRWEVSGRQQVWVLDGGVDGGARRAHGPGDEVPLPPPAA